MFLDSVSDYILFLLVLTRMMGVFLFNPMLGRKSMPSMLKIGMALAVSILVTPTLPPRETAFGVDIAFIAALAAELFVGFLMGFVVNLFTSFLTVAGELSDVQMGLGMAKIYDQQSGASMPVTATVYNLMLTLVFFGANGHLTLIRMAARSCEAFPPGEVFINTAGGAYIALLFGDVLHMALKLALPVIALELLTEAGMGVLMRTVPQINVFVAGIQIKLLLGLVVLMFLLPTAAGVIGSALDSMFVQLEDSMVLMLGG